jgi:hypothetical protein
MAKGGLFKKTLLLSLTIGIVSSLSGCVYYNNQSLDDMSYEEKQEVFQSLDDVREELKEDFSDNTADFALEIVDKVEQIIIESSD